MTSIDRRNFLKAGVALGVTAPMYGCAGLGSKSAGHVVVVGGGFGGATVAKYLRMWSNGAVAVTLIERNPRFISCPMSNLVIGGMRQMEDISISYDALRNNWGVKVVQGEVTGIDANQRQVRLGDGNQINYDRLVLSPGIDFLWGEVPALKNEAGRDSILHAWKAGPQTLALRKQLESMRDGGVFAISIPKAPFRCPPGPYERACMVASYLKQNKPKSKVVVLDANAEIQSKKALFTKAWDDLYKGIVEYRPDSELKDVDVANVTAVLEFDMVKADVLNVIPPQRAGNVAATAGLKLINNRWVEVDWLSMESTSTPGIHVLGDALFPGPLMPKSGHMANQHGKLAAAAILNLLDAKEPSATPLLVNTCYSFVDAKNAIHVSSVHAYDATTKLMQPVKGAGGVSVARNEVEAKLALGWAQNIWADMLA